MPQPSATINSVDDLKLEFNRVNDLQKDLGDVIKSIDRTSTNKEELEFLETLIQEDKST